MNGIILTLAFIIFAAPLSSNALSEDMARTIVSQYEELSCLQRTEIFRTFFKKRSLEELMMFEREVKNLDSWPHLSHRKNLIIVSHKNKSYEYRFGQPERGEVIINGTLKVFTKEESLDSIAEKISNLDKTSFNVTQLLIPQAHAWVGVVARVGFGLATFIPDVLAVREHMQEIRKLEKDCDKIRKNVALFRDAKTKVIAPAFAELLKVEIKLFLSSVKNKDYPIFACYKDLNKSLKEIDEQVCE